MGLWLALAAAMLWVVSVGGATVHRASPILRDRSYFNWQRRKDEHGGAAPNTYIILPLARY